MGVSSTNLGGKFLYLFIWSSVLLYFFASLLFSVFLFLISLPFSTFRLPVVTAMVSSRSSQTRCLIKIYLSDLIIFSTHMHMSRSQYLIEEKSIATGLESEGAIGALVKLVARVWVRVDLVPIYNWTTCPAMFLFHFTFTWSPSSSGHSIPVTSSPVGSGVKTGGGGGRVAAGAWVGWAAAGAAWRARAKPRPLLKRIGWEHRPCARPGWWALVRDSWHILESSWSPSQHLSNNRFRKIAKLSLSKNDQKWGDHLAPATPTKTVAILNDFMLRKFWTVENHKDKKHFGCGLITWAIAEQMRSNIAVALMLSWAPQDSLPSHSLEIW